MATADYHPRVAGQPWTTDFRIYLEGDQNHELVSPWHDVPLYTDGGKAGQVVNMVVEIPRFGNAKMEIAKDEFLTPIKQDVKKGQLRYVPNIFPYKGYAWNYGAFPQTWEDPSHIDPDTQAPGDDDPLDVCEIGRDVGFTGQVKPVKVLGALAILDQGETDWKVIAIDVTDPLAEKLEHIADVDRHMPGFLDSMKYWFSVYKVPEGKPENSVALGGEVRGEEFAISLINDCHEAWKTIVYNEGNPPHKDSLKDIGVVEHRDLTHRISQTPPVDTKSLQPPDKVKTDRSFFLPSYHRDVGWNVAMYG